MKSEFNAMKSVQFSEGYKYLQALWAQQGTKILDAMQKAAGRGQESAWRYYAGQLKGFDLAITQLERALLQMERDEDNIAQEQTVEQMLQEIKGEKHS